MYLTAAVLLLVLALIMFAQAERSRRAAGLPGGRVIYSDTSQWAPLEEPLYDPVVKVTGRPDYLFDQGDFIIPVEVKSGRVPNEPYDSHIYQVAAYCLLVEREFGKRPPYGVIHYGKRTFAVDYTPELEDALLELLSEMRRSELKQSLDRSHEEPARCRGCGFGYTCEQSI